MPRQRAVLWLLFIAACCMRGLGTVQAQPVVYVDKNATGPVHDGSTWCQAYIELSTALDVAVAGDTVRVADGTYKPDSTGLADQRQATFEMRTGVRIEGGYAGCGSPDPDARNLALFETILSGDLNGDDVPPLDSDCFVYHDTLGCDNDACEAAVCAFLPDCCESEYPWGWNGSCVRAALSNCCEAAGRICDNTYHVVSAASGDASTVLDGFTITAGQARGEFGTPESIGGGIIVTDSNATISGCRITDNFALASGGGIGIEGGSPTITDCDIHDNKARSWGGGLYCANSRPTIADCAIRSNSSGLSGGGLYLRRHSAMVRNCVITGNYSDGSGGGIGTSDTFLTLSNSTISENSTEARGRGAGIDAEFSTLSVAKCALIANGVFGETPSVGAMSLYYCDATVRNTLITGNSGEVTGAVYGLESLLTFSNCTIVFNVAVTSVRGAGFEVDNSILTIDDSVLWGNVADGRINQTTQVTSAGLSSTTVAYTSLQGWNAYFGGVGNFGDDPMFIDAVGPDGASGTEDDDLRLLPGSPCINTGDPAFVATEGETDLGGNARLQGCRVDLGAYEMDTVQLLGDFNADDEIDLRDVGHFQNCFRAAVHNPHWLEACLCVFDFNEDSAVDIGDFSGFYGMLTGPAMSYSNDASTLPARYDWVQPWGLGCE